MHPKKRAEHGHRIVAPQSAVTPNDLFGHAHNPAGNVGIASVNKLPALPIFIVRSGRFTWTVSVAATIFFLVSVVFLAREKRSVVHVLPNIRFKGAILFSP